MIVSNIIGGLGNQMFQYARGKAMSLRDGKLLRLAVDQFEKYELHNGYELHRIFNLPDSIATRREMREALNWGYQPQIRKLLAHRALGRLRPANWLQEKGMAYEADPAIYSPATYLHGYWQSAKYFEHEAEAVRALFCFPEPRDANNCKLLELVRRTNSIGIHVRRGDYLTGKNSGLFSQLGESYYRSAVESIANSTSNLTLYLFSDDLKWALHLLESVKHKKVCVDFNHREESFRDMQLMANCKHNIIANSTFSWWGAWLNPEPTKTVVAPRHWFVSPKHSDEDLIPSSWRRF